MNFWQKLPKPFTVLAPMDDVTDYVFREIIATELGHALDASQQEADKPARWRSSHAWRARPDVFFTEFTSTDALTSKGYDAQIARLRYSEHQRPIVAQIWGSRPEKFFKVAKLICELKFDGVDTNMGCPDKTIIKNGSCSALIENPSLASEIIQATREGASGLPVSVKTRLGFKGLQTEKWISHLLKQNLDALTIHGRVACEMSQFPADWDEIGKCVKIKNEIAPNTVIIGNGDIKSYTAALNAARHYDVSGVMIGRGVLENILVFNKSDKTTKLSKNELINLYIKHIELFRSTWSNTKNPSIIKKFMKVYLRGFEGSSTLRQRIANAKGYSEMTSILTSN